MQATPPRLIVARNDDLFLLDTQRSALQTRIGSFEHRGIEAVIVLYRIENIVVVCDRWKKIGKRLAKVPCGTRRISLLEEKKVKRGLTNEVNNDSVILTSRDSGLAGHLHPCTIRLSSRDKVARRGLASVALKLAGFPKCYQQ